MKICTCLLAIMINLTVYAQFTEIAVSKEFEEPRDGHLKIITNAIGETFLIHIDKEGFHVRKYDIHHTLTIDKTLQSVYGELHSGKLLSVVSSDKGITIFTSEMNKRVPALYRQILNTNTCTFSEETLIDSMPKVKLKVKMAILATDRDYNRRFDFFVKTDPVSGCYATAAYNTDEEAARQVHINHYTPDHRLISSAYFTVPGDEYIYYDYKDMCVNGDRQVVVTAVADAGKRSKLYMGVLTAGADSFILKSPAFTGVNDLKNFVTRYNNATGEYITIFHRVKEETKKAFRMVWKQGSDTIFTEPILGGSFKNAKKSGYFTSVILNPMTQNLSMNADGSYRAIYEDISSRSRTYATESPLGGNSFTAIRIFCNDLTIVDYDRYGKIIGSTTLPKSFQPGMTSKIAYYSLPDIDEIGMELSAGSQFKSFYYLNGKSKDYILFNDDEKNQERIDKHKKPETVTGMGNCRAYAMLIDMDAPKPARTELFQEEVTRRNRPIIIPGISAYNKDTDELAVLKVNYESKKASVAWLKPE